MQNIYKHLQRNYSIVSEISSEGISTVFYIGKNKINKQNSRVVPPAIKRSFLNAAEREAERLNAEGVLNFNEEELMQYY